MSQDGTYIRELATHLAKPSDLSPDATVALPPGWQIARPPRRDGFRGLRSQRLSAVVGYIHDNVDEHDISATMVVVSSTDRVELVSKHYASGNNTYRDTIFEAEDEETPFGFGSYLGAEEFRIRLATQFAPTPDRDALMALVSSIKESDVRELDDDGISQEVKTARGIMLDKTRAPNPVVLAPFRTFREVEPVESKFLFRMRRSSASTQPDCALFEMDGGAWKIATIGRIVDWLKERLPDDTAVIG